MGRKRSFLGFFATLFVAFFTANAFAAGYSCPSYKKYTSCNAGYYLNGTEPGNACASCSDIWSGSTSAGGTTVGAANSCYKTITLNKNDGSGDVAGVSGTTSATIKCYYGANCSFPSASGLTQDTYTFDGGWGTTTSCASTTTSFAYNNLANTYYACKTQNKITATETDKSKVYDGTPLTCNGVSVSVPSSGATIKYGVTSGTYNLSSAPTITNVADSKTIYYQVTANNYVSAEGSFECKITKATMNASLAGNSKTYDGSALTCDGGTQTGVPNNSNITYSTTDGSGYTLTKPVRTNAGTTTVYYNITNNNYNDFAGSFSCKVTKASNPISVSSCGGNIVYPNSDTFTVSGAQGTVSVSSNATSVATVSLSGTTGTVKSVATGNATITVKAAGNDNYYTGQKTCSYTVNPGTITATVSSPSKTYDGDALSCAGISNVGPSDAEVRYATKSGTTCGTYSSTIPSRTDTGTTTVCYKIAATNYNDKTGEFTCTVNSTTGSVVIKDGSANVSNGSGSTTYPNNKTLTATCPGGEATPTVSSATTSVATATISNGTITLKPVAAGTSEITVSCAKSTNYAASSAKYTLTVNRGTCSISVSPTSSTITYPTTTSTFTINKGNCNGTLNAESNATNVATVAINGTTGTVSYVSAGDATITVKSAQSNQYNAATATYTVKTVPGTIDATSSNDSKTYDGTALTCDGNIKITAPTSGTTITYGIKDGTYDLTTAPQITNVADSKTIYYIITANNYTAKTGSFNCTVEKADNTLTLSSTSRSMAYGENATFTITKNVSGGALSVISSATDIATASLSGTTVSLTAGTKYGTSEITVTSEATANYKAATAVVTVVANMGTITLNNQSADTAGTSKIYQTYNANVYLDSARKNAMTTSANAITKPTKTGHTFAGYYDSTSYGTQYIAANGTITSAGVTAGKALKTNGTWYAKWDENEYTVKYSCGDGTGTPPANGTATYNQNFTPAANTGCVREGYTFNGWNDGTTNRAAGTAFKWTYTSDKTFTADWMSENEKAITFNKNGGTINGSYTAACNVDTATFTLPTVTRAGHTFEGWYNNSDFSGNAITSVVKGTCTTALTFWAKWEPCNQVVAGACNCASSQYPANGTCTSCSTSCSGVSGYTQGTYNVCNAETTDLCYRACTTDDVPGATAVSGTITKGGVNTCKATTCGEDYFKQDGGCTKCPENAETCGGGDDSWECDTGYDKSASGTACIAKKYTVTLDNQSATTAGTASVTATYNKKLDAITAPTKTDYAFGGYYTGENCTGTKYYDENGTGILAWNIDSATTLYACWVLDVFQCTAGKAADGTDCTPGFFCPGDKVNADVKNSTTAGCERLCPSATGAKSVTSPNGATANTQCTATYENVDIYESTKTTVTGSGTETCNWNGSNAYNASCNTVPVSCIGGYYRPADNSPFCNPVGYGFYRGAGEAVRTQNDCSKLDGANSTVTTATDKSTASTACYNVCPTVATTDGNGVRNPENAIENYNGTTIPACSYTTSCNEGYAPRGEICDAEIYTITLNHNGGMSNVDTIYLKYADGWYADENANTKITTVQKPTLSGQTFGGYLSGNTVVVDNTGAIVAKTNLFESDETITASWSNNPTIVCKAGTYYPGTGASCATCTTGSYCEGISTIQDTGEAGRATCAAGAYTAAKDKEGATLSVQISSPEGSDSADDCYATNVAYTPNQYTSGSQTCHYDATAKSYSANCDTKVVITCAGGYALATTSAIVCTETGKGKYSPDKDLEAHECPLYPGTEVRGTTNKTATASIEECVVDNLWDTETIAHGGVRKQCYWTEASKGYDQNCPQFIVVTCDAGYWYDASKNDCVSVGDGAWSPAQSECDGEDLQPITPGCSTKINYCPGGALTGKENASSVLECEGVCPAGSYCVDGVEYSCATETNDEYPYSVAGSDEVGDCYKKADGCACSQDCPADGISTIYCSMNKKETFSGIIYQSAPSECVLLDTNAPKSCSYKKINCGSDYYFSGDLNGEWSCKLCSSLGSCSEDNTGDNCYPYSLSSLGEVDATSEAGNAACYQRTNLYCTAPVCPTKETTEYCSYNDQDYRENQGWRFYGSDEIIPGSDINGIRVSNYLCPAIRSDGSYFDCVTGYDKNEDADIDPTDGSASSPEELCTPHVYTITLNPNYTDGATDEIYQKYKTGWYFDEGASRTLTAVPVPTRDNWTFHGYATKASALENGYKLVVDANGEFITSDAINATFTSNATWYAQWTQNVYQCQVGKYYVGDGSDSVLKDCVAPYYCPGVGTVPVGSTGCLEACPKPKIATPVEDPTTIANGQTDVTSCYANFATSPTSGEELADGDGTWKCQYAGTSASGEYASCVVIVESCDAGYYNQAGTSACNKADSGYYSPDGDLVQTQCPQKTNYTVGTDEVRDAKTDCYVDCSSYVPAVEHSTDVYVTAGDAYKKMFWANETYPTCQYTVECATGYTSVSGANPQCKANEYEITLNQNGGSGDIAETVRCTFNGNDCALPATSVLKRAGYNTANKWCVNADGTGACYEAGKVANGNVSSNGTNTVLYAIWEPAIFKVELSAPDADTNAAQGPVYLKYATGWYSDAAAQKPITTLGVQLPGKGGEAYVFAGYKLNDQMIIDANGALSGAAGALTATTENATALVQWTKGLTKCEAGTYYTGNGSSCAECEANHYCPEGRYATDSGTVGGLNPCPLDGLSAGGTSATNIGVCYKTGMDYLTYIDAENTMTRARGTWTCNYGAIGYTNCHEDTIEITWCAAGHWLASQTAIDCDMVGADYWSAEKELQRYACPDGGNTNGATTSDALTDCQKRVDTYVSVSNNAKGTYVCNARTNGDAVIYDQNCKIDTVEITWCAGGYWYDAEQTEIDCVEVGQNFFSAEGDIDKDPCPHDGTTVIPNASTPHNICQKTKNYPGIEYTGPAVNGRGVHGCLYDQAADGMMFGEEMSDGYVSCGKITMTECNSGYWWQNGEGVCKEVEQGYFGPVADANNSNNKTGRMACPDNGKTHGTKSVDATACYLEKLACDITNGTGEQTRFWDSPAISDAAGYNVCRIDGQITECNIMCDITGCNPGFSLVDGACINCPENHVCVPEGGQQSCAIATNGTHPKSDAGTTEVAYCYADCVLGQYAYAMKGRDYYGANVADTCEITMCMAGYTLSNGKCVECPAGMICNPESGDDAPKSCATLTGGEYAESASNSDSIDDCYKVCEPYEVVNGTAVPVADKAFYPNECEFEGKSANGNPCEIVDGVCTETSCNYNFEMAGGICKPCAREHAISYKKEGNCVVESCASGYHPNGQQCEDDVIECSAPNAVSAKQTWDTTRNAFGACMITECEAGYHLGANTCQVDEQVCELEHGVGVREWNHKTNTWGECIATKCEPGYTNDPSLTNELWKQCGRCNNMYSANGELAASSYVQGCEIAACMYQGELYTLENNECRLICDTYSDETGSRRWNASRKKCERTCEPGYTSW